MVLRSMVRPTTMLHEPLTEEERKTLVRLAVPVAIAVVFVMAIPLLALGGYVWHESKARANENASVARENRALIDRLERLQNQQAQARVRNRERFALSDRTLCLRIEAIKAQVRETIAFDEAETRLTLTQLGIDPDSPKGQALIERSRQTAAERLKRFMATKCAALPSAKATEPGGANG